MPLQPPEDVHEVASVEDHVSVEPLPLVTLPGIALSVTEGSGAGVTTTLAVPEALPPAPVHVSLNVESAKIGPTDWLPDVAFAPLQAPVALQLVAFNDVHVRTDDRPDATTVGFAPNETVGTGSDELTITVADALALFPPPVQLRAYVLFAVNAPVLCDPAVPLLPLQAPDAVHSVAFDVLHVSVALHRS